MEGFRTDPATQSAASVELAAGITDITTRRILRSGSREPAMRCVSSGYLSRGSSCTVTIPGGVVTDAWASQKRAGIHGDRFFHFTWQGEVWLAYGLKDGRIRGVYCPEHSAERDQRSLSDGSGEEGARANIALTG
jgi:hypothetical protein